MPSLKFFYTVHNNGDHSASVNFHADAKAAQIACNIEEENEDRFSENEVEPVELEFDSHGKLLTPTHTKHELAENLLSFREMPHAPNKSGDILDLGSPSPVHTSITPTETGSTVKLIYTVINCGDGSAVAYFHEDEEAANIACAYQEELGEAFAENYPRTIELRFDKNGTLLNPTVTQKELEKKLKETLERKEWAELNRPPMNPALRRIYANAAKNCPEIYQRMLDEEDARVKAQTIARKKRGLGPLPGL